MGRRSDHSRPELMALIVGEGRRLLAETGFARFSARELAKRIGYSVGTVTSLYGGVDGLVTAINGATFRIWAEALEQGLEKTAGAARITALVQGYFDFATTNINLWSALYEHRLPEGMGMPETLAQARSLLTRIVMREVIAVLPADKKHEGERLARSLIATVHGHCSFALLGSFAILGEDDPQGLAIDRVHEALKAHGAHL